MRTGTDPSTSGEATRVTQLDTQGTTASPPAAPLVAARAGPGLATKFSVAAALLVLLTLGGAVAVATWRANEVAEKSIRESLSALPGIFRAYQGSNEDALRRQVTSVADEPGTKGLFDAKDAKTLHDWTTDKAEKLNARTVFLFDANGVLLDRNDQEIADESRPSFAKVKWVADALLGIPATAVIREGKVLAAVASVPVLAGDMSLGEGRLRGVLAVAAPLDENRAKTLRGITNGQTGFLANTARRGEPPRVELSAATEAFRGDLLVPALAADRAALDSLFQQGQAVGPLEVQVAGDRRVLAAVPIKSATDETLGAFVVSRSRDEETAAFRRIRDTLLLVGGLALLLALPISFAMGRRIARPLVQLARGAAEIREGNLDVKLPEAGGDEVGALARAFRALLGELKEKAALEQMLAEMRRPDANVTRATTLDGARRARRGGARVRGAARGDGLRGALSDPRDARQGRHGNGLPRPRPGARRRSRRQGPPARSLRRGHHRRHDAQAGDPARAEDHAPQCRAHARPRRGGRPEVSHDGVRARHDAARHPRPEGRPRPLARPADRETALPRPRGGARGGHHPPRHQAAEHHGPPERPREAHGLRHRAHGRGRGSRHARRPDRRHAVLHEPRTGARPRARCAERHLLGRRRSLRAVLGDDGPSKGAIRARSCAGMCPSSRSPSRCSGRTCPISWRASSWRASRRTRSQRPPTANDLYGALQRVEV